MRKVTADYPLADDLAQDCFVTAWNKLHTFKGKGSLIAWLMKIAYNQFLQSKRSQVRYHEILETLGTQMLAHGDDSVSSMDELSDLDQYLAILSEPERAAMILSFAYGMSHREIGATLNLPDGSVKSHIYRGKQKIKMQFESTESQGDNHDTTRQTSRYG